MERSRALTAGTAELTRSGGGCGRPDGRCGQRVRDPSRQSAAGLLPAWSRPTQSRPPHWPRTSKPALRARPAARARPAPASHLPASTPHAPRVTEPLSQLLGPSERRKRCLKTQGNGAKTSNLRQAARTSPAAPAPILHGDCQRSRTTQGGALSQRCPRTQALAKERAFCTKVTLLFLIMKIAGN